MTKHSGTKASSVRWLLLVHQLPAKPAYARVKIWRQLQEAGAVNLKGAVYILPSGDDGRTRFELILKQIEAHGGEGVLYESELVAGMRNDQIRSLFNTARDTDYHALTMELRQLARAWKKAKKPKSDPVMALARLSQRLSALAAIDFFHAPERTATEALLAELEHSNIRKEAAPGPQATRPADLHGKTWVTRQDIHVDRIACAWLIRRFIDPKATLRFVPVKQYQPRANEYRYDMQDGEFTHEGDRCSFETLQLRAGIADPALQAIAEIIHDIDIKDGKFRHPETSGIAHVISGICRTQGDDEARVARGTELFNDIYEQFRRGNR